MYNKKTGLFKETSQTDITDAETNSEVDQVQRTGLMSQKSRKEYEVASKDSNVTLVQFDQQRDSTQN
jgi:hypothetical protein